MALTQQPERRGAADAPRRAAEQKSEADRANDPNQPNRAERRQPTDPDRPGQARRPGDQGQMASQDGELAACLIIDNNKEIAFAELARQHAQNEEVKRFAEQMIQDHQKFVEQLQQTAASAGYTEQQLALQGGTTGERPAAAGAPRQPSTTPADRAQARTQNERTQNEPGNRSAARPGELDTAQSRQGADFIGIKREVAEQCLQSAREELEGASAADFDKHYIGSQVMAHQGMVDALTVFARHASPELRQTLEQGQQTAQQHLEHARQIKQQLAQSAGGEQPRQRDSRTNN